MAEACVRCFVSRSAALEVGMYAVWGKTIPGLPLRLSVRLCLQYFGDHSSDQ